MLPVEIVLYALFWFFGTLVSMIPLRARESIARALGIVWFDVVRFRRQVILHNLALVFTREREESMAAFKSRCERLGRRNAAHYILSFLELLERFHWTDRTMRERIKFEGVEHLGPAIHDGQGMFILTAHLGNWELITLVGKLLGVKLAIVTRKLRNGFFDRIWVRSRRRYGLELLQESGSGLSMIRGIRSGKAIGFILDQHTGEPHGIEATFLGRKAWCPKGLAILSTRLECPVVPAYLLREPNGTFTLHVEAPLQFPKLADPTNGLRTESGALTEAGLRYHIGICNENMEKWILKSPEQYLWLHKRFKNILDYSSPLPWQL